jgi:hypothetical protein
MIIRYLSLSVIQVFLMAFQWVFSYFIARTVDKDGHYPWYFKWFEPKDSLATGDEMYWNNEMAYCLNWPEPQRSYERAFNWGQRNPACGFASVAGFTIKSPAMFTTNRTESPDIDIGEAGVTVGSVYRILTNGDSKKYFEYRKIFPSLFGTYFYIQLGWSIPTLVREEGDKCHLCFYIRPFAKV